MTTRGYSSNAGASAWPTPDDLPRRPIVPVTSTHSDGQDTVSGGSGDCGAKRRIVLGFDPSANDTGWGIVNVTGNSTINIDRIESGCFHPSKAVGALDRFDQLAAKVYGLVEAHRCCEVAIEIPSGGQRHSATQLMIYARAIGVCEAAAWLSGAIVRRVTVTEWKGRSSKAAAAATCRMILKHEPATTHEADALALAIWAAMKGGT